MSEERRVADRVSPKAGGVISVRDRISDTELGTIANISETGFMLVSNRFIDIDSVFQFELHSMAGEFDNIQLGAVCLWNADTSSEASFWAGFHIIDISPDAELLLHKAIEQMSV